MTSLAGVFGRAAHDAESATARMARIAAGSRGDGRAERESDPARSAERELTLEVWCGPQAVIASCRQRWEESIDGWSGPVLHAADDLVVAADASLYYLSDLRRKLSVYVDVAALRSSAEVIAAAVRIWGSRFATVIEGDFAVIVWDPVRRHVLLSRDACGRRSLFHAVLDDGSLVVASTARAVAGFPGVPRGYDLEFLAAAAACLMTHGDRSAFSRIRPVPAGRTLRWSGHSAIPAVDMWIPPAFSDDWTSAPSDDAAEELRALLERAVLERLPRSGRATVWMSGGADSTAVFAAGRSALETAGTASCELLPVSVSYPEGDPGREDHFIADLAARWSAPVRWIPVDTISIAEEAERRRQLRDDPMPHHFEMMQRILGRATRSLDSRIALDGFGGDQLFYSSPDAVLADHLFRGRVAALARQWWRQRDRSPRAFVRRCLLPFATPPLFEWLHAVTGRRISGAMELEPPSWIRSRDVLLQRSRAVEPRRPDESVGAYETRYLLTNPYMPRVMFWTHRYALDEGLLLRSPLYDPRVIAFAATRPLSERQDGRAGKNLLRRAMRGLIPDSVLAPRGRKTGTSEQYFRRQMSTMMEHTIKPALRDRAASLRLADLGLVEPRELVAAIARYEANPEDLTGAQLFTTFETELWLATPESAP